MSIYKCIGSFVIVNCVFFYSFLNSVHAGTIGFSISFTGDDIAITNTGSEAAYQISEWTLDQQSHWQKATTLEGSPAYLPPGKTLNSRRLFQPGVSGLGRFDPLLLVLHDQAGSRIAQLAWRRTPLQLEKPMHTLHLADRIIVSPDVARQRDIVATHAIVIPFEGSKRLARPFSIAEPPNPQRHNWQSNQSMALNTGKGQNGAWLVHESANGDLHLQIVPDGSVRGQEHMPAWLVWARQHMFRLASVLAGLGTLVAVAGLFVALRRAKQSAAAS